jgi:integration host factor subunit alpha
MNWNEAYCDHMKKADIAKSIHEQAAISETRAEDLLEWVLALLTSTLQQGEPIIITGFGKFTVRKKEPRKGRNPRTGETIIVPGHRVVTFRPSALWKAELNAQSNIEE